MNRRGFLKTLLVAAVAGPALLAERRPEPWEGQTCSALTIENLRAACIEIGECKPVRPVFVFGPLAIAALEKKGLIGRDSDGRRICAYGEVVEYEVPVWEPWEHEIAVA